MGAILWAILQKAVLPEVLRAVTDHFAATGTIPTEAELEAKLHADADAIAARMSAFIDG